jgi:hypothetical protein
MFLKGTVTDCLNELAADLYDEEINKLKQSLSRWPHHNGDYVEK